MLNSRSCFAAVKVAEKVYAFGGADSPDGSIPSVEVYDTACSSPSDGGWSELPPMPCCRENFAAVAVDDIIYLLGGYYETPDGGVTECPNTSYNTTSQTWSNLPSGRACDLVRYGHAAAVVGRDIYIVGGCADYEYLDTMRSYNVDSKKWTYALSLIPTPRTNCAAVAIGVEIIVIGGTTSTDKRLMTVEAYDTISQEWTTLPSMNYGRMGCAVTTILDDTNILVVGGSDDAICEVFSWKSNSWSILPNKDTNITSKRYFSAVSTIGHSKVLVMGGTGPCGGQTTEIMTLSLPPTFQKILTVRSVIKQQKQDIAPQQCLTVRSVIKQQKQDIAPQQCLGSPWAAPKNTSKLLYIDAANFTTNFFNEHDHWNLTKAHVKIRRFCTKVKEEGYTLVAFIDDTRFTSEAVKKWRTRREREVKAKQRRVPQSALRLTGDMFRLCGVPVRYSSNQDNDDTLAYYAHVDSATVLSEDKDFLRYKGTSFQIFKDFKISNARNICWVQQDGMCKSDARDILPCAPITTPDMDHFKCRRTRTYTKGSPSPVVDLGNLHIHVRPLRAALYFHFNLDFAVEEEFPVYDNGECIWDKMSVVADQSYCYLLKYPETAVKLFENKQSKPLGVTKEDWFKHRFGLRALVAEICCEYSGSTLFETLEPMMRDINMSANERARPWRKKNVQKNVQKNVEKYVQKKVQKNVQKNVYGRIIRTKPHKLRWEL